MASNQKSMTVSGNTPARLPYPQSLRGDFLWTLAFWNGSGPTKTAKDLTGYVFSFYIYGPDGTTKWIEKAISTGVTVTGNVVEIAFDKAAWTVTSKVFLKGCKYNMNLDSVSGTGFDQPLFELQLLTT